MKRFLGGIALVGLAMSLAAGAAQAQQEVWYSPAFGAGVGIFGDFALGLSDDTKLVDPRTAEEKAPMAYGGHAYLGASMFKIWAGAWYVNNKVDGVKNELAFGGNLGVTVYKGATSPIYVDLMGGAFYSKLTLPDSIYGLGSDLEGKQWDFPVSLPVSYGAMLAGGHTVEPWIAPTLHIVNTKETLGATSESSTDLGFGVSGGINFYSAMGIGAYAMIAWQSVKIGDAAESITPLALGAGLAWRFSVPSLPESKGFVGG
jgi:hypothetical protein